MHTTSRCLRFFIERRYQRRAAACSMEAGNYCFLDKLIPLLLRFTQAVQYCGPVTRAVSPADLWNRRADVSSMVSCKVNSILCDRCVRAEQRTVLPEDVGCEVGVRGGSEAARHHLHRGHHCAGQADLRPQQGQCMARAV